MTGDGEDGPTRREEDIQEVREEEERRGRKPIDRDAKNKRERVLRGFREALRQNNRALFLEIIVRDLGFEPGSPGYENALRGWKRRHGAH